MNLEEAKKFALLQGIKGFLAGAGERGKAVAALLEELKDCKMEGIVHSGQSFWGIPCGVGGFEINLSLPENDGLITITVEMDSDVFDALWTKCNLAALMPKAEDSEAA
jgi:hypothetical protein